MKNPTITNPLCIWIKSERIKSHFYWYTRNKSCIEICIFTINEEISTITPG
jgi:hypothetical protein